MPKDFYLIAPTISAGVAEGTRRGWRYIALDRFATMEKENVRLITRYNDLKPFPGGSTPMLRAAGYADGDGLVLEYELDRWIRDKDRFDEFVESGEGVWME